MSNHYTLDISWNSIIKIFIAAICFYILFLIKDIIVWLIFALIISSLLNPAIDYLQSKKAPRILGAIFVYFVIFGILAFLIYLITSPIIYEVGQFSRNFPQYFEKISPVFEGLGIEAFKNMESFRAAVESALGEASKNIFNALFAFFGGITSTLFIIAVAFFISLEEKSMERFLRGVAPHKDHEEYVSEIWAKCQVKVSGWFASRILACLFIGIATYFALLLFEVDYAASLALLAAITNFIPFIGPATMGALLLVVVSVISFSKALFVLLAFTVIQQIENNIISPFLTKKFIGLSPALALIAIAIGGKLWGILGAILVIPLAGIVFEFTKDYLEEIKNGHSSDDGFPNVRKKGVVL